MEMPWWETALWAILGVFALGGFVILMSSWANWWWVW